MEENIGRLNVAVDDVCLMQLRQSLKDVIPDPPNILFRNSTFEGLSLFYLPLKVTIVGVLHHDAQHFRFIIVECFLIGDNKGAFNRGEESNLIERILFVFFFQFVDLDLHAERVTCFMA
jgi:hypothetical protein